MDKVFVAKGVADQLLVAEKALELAIIETQALSTKMLQARHELNLGATVGSAELAGVAQTLAGLEAARLAITGTHAGLDEVRLRIGVRTKLTGAYKTTAQQGEAVHVLARDVG